MDLEYILSILFFDLLFFFCKKVELFLAKAKRDGYVETMFGRRRYIKELAAKNKNLQAFGERVAKNTPIQCTACLLYTSYTPGIRAGAECGAAALTPLGATPQTPYY